jgi:hypothetical protein
MGQDLNHLCATDTDLNEEVAHLAQMPAFALHSRLRTARQRAHVTPASNWLRELIITRPTHTLQLVGCDVHVRQESLKLLKHLM